MIGLFSSVAVIAIWAITVATVSLLVLARVGKGQ